MSQAAVLARTIDECREDQIPAAYCRVFDFGVTGRKRAKSGPYHVRSVLKRSRCKADEKSSVEQRLHYYKMMDLVQVKQDLYFIGSVA